MQFKNYNLSESRFADYFADQVFKVSQMFNFGHKYVVLRLEDDGEFYAHFISGGKLKSSRSTKYGTVETTDYRGFKEDKNGYLVLFQGNYFEFKDRYGSKYKADYESDLVKDISNVVDNYPVMA